MRSTNVTYDEYEILKVLAKSKRLKLVDVAREVGKRVDEIRRSVESLKSKNMIKVEVAERVYYYAGERLKKLGQLPEVKVAEYLKRRGKIKLSELFNSNILPIEDIKASLGILRKLGVISIVKENGDVFIEVIGEIPSDRIKISKLLLERERVKAQDLKDYSKLVDELVKRPGIINTEVIKEEIVAITDEGLKVIMEKREPPRKVVTLLTPQLLISGRWREVEFKEYDVTLPAPPVYAGRRHPLRDLLNEIREIFLSMGFIEEWGPLIELAFWNFDALFQPQDHPARDMHDTFYLKRPKYGNLERLDIIDRVKRTHEDGWVTRSTGWRYTWRIEEARKYVLRTHTTAVTVKKVYEYGEKPVKIFAVGKVFRNETIDYKHLAEFFNVDGIVIDPHTNLRELLGILEVFYRKLGFKKIIFWPSYFPYTEPSVQVCIYDENTGKYIEMAGSGIFRPEVTIPLGVKWPVLAWGLGVERILMLRYGLTDIRKIYENDIGWLRNIKYIRPSGGSEVRY